MRRTTTKNTGTRNTASTVAADHAAHDAGADGMTAVGARAGGNRQRQHAEHEGDRGHQDRAESQAAGFQRGIDQVMSLVLQVAGKLDDQDRVLRRQADDDDQADLEVDVVGQAAQSTPPAPRRGYRSAPPGSPPTESTSSHTAPPDTGRRRSATSRTGTAPDCRKAVLRWRCPTIRSRSRAAVGPRFLPSPPCASPVLRPGAGLPEIFIAGRPL